MNSKERVRARLEGRPVDRIPNLNILMQFAAKFIGVPYGKYATDYRSLVEGNIQCCREFGIDMVSAISDPFRETSGFGAEVVINPDDVPSVKNYLIKDYGDIKRLRPADPLGSERMLDRIEAVRLYKETVGDEYPILGWIEGPIAEAGDLRGVGDIMFDLVDEPGFVNELMEICVEQGVSFAREQVRAGADFIGIGDAAASLVGPGIYRESVLPLEKKLIREIHAMGARVKLHICGNTTSLLELMPLSGADIIDIDWMVNMGDAYRAFGEKACLCGNFDPVTVLLQGTPETVKENVIKCIKASGPTTFISAGCEVPKHTPAANLKAVAEALAEYTD